MGGVLGAERDEEDLSLLHLGVLGKQASKYVRESVCKLPRRRLGHWVRGRWAGVVGEAGGQVGQVGQQLAHVHVHVRARARERERESARERERESERERERERESERARERESERARERERAMSARESGLRTAHLSYKVRPRLKGLGIVLLPRGFGTDTRASHLHRWCLTRVRLVDAARGKGCVAKYGVRVDEHL